MSFELTDEEGKFLIHLARNTVKQYLETGKAPKPPKETPKKLFEHCGVFVTINSIKGMARRSFAAASATPTPQAHLWKQ